MSTFPNSSLLSGVGTAEASNVGTFGYTTVGALTFGSGPGEKVSCSYQASQTGTLTSISMYIQTGGAQVLFGVYSDLDGQPGFKPKINNNQLD
jgi:hypothetical protein